MTKMILPRAKIGIIGGGQLGQMMIFSAKEMGYQTIVLDPDETCPAGQVADEQIVASYDDFTGLKDLAKKSDLLTYEFENVSVEALEKLGQDINLPQGVNLLAKTQDRLAEKDFLESCQIKIAPYRRIETEADLRKALNDLGYPSVLKTSRGGYDGKGQLVLREKEDFEEAKSLLKLGTCVLEAWIPFEREISVIVAGNGYDYKTFPVAENIHVNNILHESLVPARISGQLEDNAKKMALIIANKLKLRGVLAIEMFVGRKGELYVNELAPRPHNSGHYTIEACDFSQFDAHIRGVLGLPLADIKLLSRAIMINVLGEKLSASYELMKEKDDWHFHYYGKKEAKVGRKMGHITILTDDLSTSMDEIDRTNIW
ncbi:5-(carboxyamino)imidazole ribonucleotide synthase [Streptococcaceae bacterium ESL0729]|nr:5-(carboxyamino)imidazole ribonucleotide synthase [Streptococcaceae bacterium ESL0729]